MNQSVEDKLTAARTRLLLDHPFLGALVLRLPLQMVSKSWCPTIATDAHQLFYNPEYVQLLDQVELEFMLAHEAMHCALLHFVRRGHRNLRRWDLACDLAINPILMDEGLRPPPDTMVLTEYSGMTAEEIYPLVDDDMEQGAPDEHLYDGQSGGKSDTSPQSETSAQKQTATDAETGSSPEPLSYAEREQLARSWRQRLAGAAQQAAQAGKLSGTLQRLVDDWLQPVLPWRVLLARYMTQAGREDYSYSRTSRRHGEAILPSLRSSQIDLVVIIDSSGSISDGEISEFLAEVNALKGQVRARVTLLACDNELDINCPWVFESWEEIIVPPACAGGGGTDFRPAFDWLQDQHTHTDLMLYFTDGLGPFPEVMPQIPVVWLIKGKAKVPWGVRIQLN